MEEEEETWLWDAGEQGGGKLWDRGKEIPWDFLPSAPSSIKSHWIAGTMASLDPFHSLPLNKMLEKRGAKGACKGKGSMVGTLCPPAALGSH